MPSLELPKGGGALQGIGEKFQAGAATGTGTFSIPIAMSPGRNGFGPQLALAYDSGAGNGPFGLGWGVGLPSIRRRTQRGIPRYLDELESDTFVLAGAEDLVPALRADGARETVEDEAYTRGHVVTRYRPRIEGAFARIERWVRITDGDCHWRVITGDNVTTIYGTTEASRIDDGARVFEWLVERSYDDKGNVVVYEYKPEDHVGVEAEPAELGRLRSGGGLAQRYIKRVRYGNTRPYRADDRVAWEADNRWLFELVFDYGEHAEALDEQFAWPVRPDAFSTYRAGFEIRTYRLCRRVLMFHRFGDPMLVRSTELHHEANPVATQLIEVVHAGHEPGHPMVRTPGVRLGYSRAVLGDRVESVGEAVHRFPDGERAHWIDLDGEGLSGILAQYAGAWFYQRNQGEARFEVPAIVGSLPSIAAAGPAGEQLLDLTGNGRLDLVVWSPGLAGAFERVDEGWRPFAAFRSVPSISLDDPQVRFLDLTGDGHADLLITEDDCLCWYPSEGEAGYGAARRVAKALDEERGPAVVFADRTQSIFLADMCGDGLTDIVRIRSGEVCYWPNLGYGYFGAKVTMGAAPSLAEPSTFDPQRIRLGDLDGTGATDLFYLDDDAIRYWRNQAGNSWSAEHRIDGLPRVDNVASVQILDLLGDGTACVVWSSDVPGTPIRYLPLLREGKPYLLTEIDGGMGARTVIRYAPSTSFYLADRRAGRPWITSLPFPVHVVDRVELHDEIGGNRFVTRYAYRHGLFDGVEREFRGFAMVEQWDTEHYAERSDDLPPVHTRTWFHTGAYEDGEAIARRLAGEYFADAWTLPDTELPPGLNGEEQREACRALKGRVLRQEVYALDGGPAVPYTVHETAYGVNVVQRRSESREAVFHVTDREQLTVHYERDTEDPRVAHTHTLEVDAYGVARRTVAIVYPRQRADALPEQRRMHVTCAEVDPIHLDGDPFTYRIGLLSEQRTFEVTGLDAVPMSRAYLLEGLASAERRLLAHGRVHYYRDTLDPDDPLPLGEAGRLGIPHAQLSLVFTPEILAQPALGGRITPALLAEGGYREDAGGWWSTTGIQLYDRARAAEMFFAPSGARDPFGAESRIEYDEHGLFPVRITDPIGNTVRAEHDYRVLAPVRLFDANNNRSEVVFDTRGMVIATAIASPHGEGDDVTDFRRPDDELPAMLADPRRYLQRATSFFHHDVFAWRRDGKPPAALSIVREQHVSQEAGTPSPLQLRISYSDGFGRAILSKAQAEDGPAPVYRDGALVLDGDVPRIAPATDRWVGNGATVFNNKGLPVRTYEPFFDSRPDFTDHAALVRIGASQTLHYDPLGRVVRTDFPDGSHSRVEVGPWQQVTYDAHDTVRDSEWYRARQRPEAAPPDRAAADQAATHHDTPVRAYLDTLGRTVIAVAHERRDGVDTYIPTRSELDIEGRPLAIHDGRRCEGLTLEQALRHVGNPVMTYAYALGGMQLHQHSMDGGSRWSLVDVAGNPLHAWTARGHHIRIAYDRLRRPTHTFVELDGRTITAQRVVYGETLPDATARNLRGKAYLQFDGAGLAETVRCDFKGSVVEHRRRLFAIRRLPGWPAVTDLTPDWSVLDGLDELTATPWLEAEPFVSTTMYDALGRAIEVTSPDGSVHLARFNKAGLLDAIRVRPRGGNASDVVTDIGYNARGQRTAIAYANGVTTTYTYDAATFRLVELNTTRGTEALQELHYTYDAIGNVTEIRDGAIAPVYFRNEEVEAVSRYTYDALYRLVEATGRESAALVGGPSHVELPLKHRIPEHDRALRNYRQLYTYDPTGNLLRMQHVATGGEWTRDYRYEEATNRLLATDADAYEHDEHGNLRSLPHLQRFTWDHTDHLAHAAIADHDDALFAYDSQRRRVRKIRVKDRRISERIYLGGCEIYREYLPGDVDPDHERQTAHVMDGDTRVCMIETVTREGGRGIAAPTGYYRFQLGNHLGSVAVELDRDARVLTYREYTPYGTLAYRAQNGDTIEVSDPRFGYTGMERDDETGLGYHTARYYIPWLGRWCSADPIGIKGGPNLYEYAAGRPVMLVDRSGRDPRRIRANLADARNDLRRRHDRLENARRELSQAVQVGQRSRGGAVPPAHRDRIAIWQREVRSAMRELRSSRALDRIKHAAQQARQHNLRGAPPGSQEAQLLSELEAADVEVDATAGLLNRAEDVYRLGHRLRGRTQEAADADLDNAMLGALRTEVQHTRDAISVLRTATVLPQEPLINRPRTLPSEPLITPRQEQRPQIVANPIRTSSITTVTTPVVHAEREILSGSPPREDLAPQVIRAQEAEPVEEESMIDEASEWWGRRSTGERVLIVAGVAVGVWLAVMVLLPAAGGGAALAL